MRRRLRPEQTGRGTRTTYRQPRPRQSLSTAADMATLQMAKLRQLTTFCVEDFHNAVVFLIQISWQAYLYISNSNPRPMGEVTLNPPPALAGFWNDKVLPL